MKENKHLEFKSEISNTFLKTVCAFANFADGEIIFGVNDDGTPCGILNLSKACFDIENKINDSINPKPDFELVIENDALIHLKVYKGEYTPYLYKGKAYRRSNTSTIEVDHSEFLQLVLEGSHMNFEELPCREPDLQFRLLEEKLQHTLQIAHLTNDILKILGFFTKKEVFNNAAAIFADQNHFSGIDIARFGKSISEIMERKMVQQESILKQYDTAVEFYRRYYQYEEISGVERKLIQLIPEDAFREAVANALIHRDWGIRAHVRVAMHTEGIEITSPGGLPAGISTEEYLHGTISNLRNPILGNVFFRMRYIEMFGTGIRRIQQAYADSKAKPVFNVTEKAICVFLPLLQEKYEATADETKILDILQETGALSSSVLAKKTGYSKAKTLRLLNKLLDKHYVKSSGNGRGRKYSHQ